MDTFKHLQMPQFDQEEAVQPAQQEAPITQVNVLDPKGNPANIPSNQVQAALNQGYSLASEEDINKAELEEKYGGIGQGVVAGAEALGRGATFGLSTGLEEEMGVPKEDIAGREQAHPYVSGILQPLGFGAALAVPGYGEAGLAEEAGVVAATKGASFLSTLGDSAIQGVFEGALYQGGDELHKAFLQDPNQTAETAIVNMGLSSVIGGVFGGALGLAFRRAAAPEIEQAIKPEVLVNSEDAAKIAQGDLGAIIKSDPTTSESLKDKIISAIDVRKMKPNADEIEAAMNEIGAPRTPGMMLDSPLIKMQVDTLAHSPHTYAGNIIRDQLDKAWTHAATTLEDAIESKERKTAAEVGMEFRDSLISDIRKAYAPVKERYDALENIFPHVPIAEDAANTIRKNLGDIKEVRIGKATDESKLVNHVLGLVENAKTAEDVGTIMNTSALKDLGTPMSKDPLGWLKAKIKSELNDIREEATISHGSSFPRNDEAGALIRSGVDQARAAKEAYKPYIQNLSELSSWMGKGKIAGTEDAIHFLENKLSPSDVARRAFSSSKDPEFLNFLREKFPSQYEMMKDYARKEFKDNASRNGEFNVNTFFKNFNNEKALAPEVKKMLYTPEEIKKIDAAQLYMKEAFPKNYNPSGTAHIEELRAAYSSPKRMLMANVRDATMKKFIEMAEKMPEIKQAQALGKSTVSGWKTTSKAIKSIFNSDVPFPTTIGSAISARDKLQKMVVDYTTNPEKLLQIGDNNPIPTYSQSFAATSQRAVQYLNSIRPSTDPKNPLDSKRQISNNEKFEYNRQCDIAQNPSLLLKHIKDGTVIPQDLQTVQAIYPGYFRQIIGQIQQEMMNVNPDKNTIPYKTRQALSMAMAMPLDSSMTSQSIMAAQPKSQGGGGQPAAAGAGPKQRGRPSSPALQKMSQLYQTPGQSAQQRRSERD